MAYTGKKPIDHTDVTQSQSMTVTDDLTVDTDTLYVDSTNNSVGIGTSSPNSYTGFTVLTLNNATNGAEIDFEKNGTVQGSIFTPASADDFTITAAHASGDLILQAGGYTERLRIQSGGGISFNGDTAAANALDDYEEGTWTPTLRNGPAIQNIYAARYIKIGNLCTAQIYINIAGNTDNDPIQVTLPFTVANITNAYWAGSIAYNNTSNTDTTALATPATNYFDIRVAGTGANRTYAQYSGGSIIATVTYQTA